MNCKVCGTRLGILERWRYGDFCSEDHKSVFAKDLEQLDRQSMPEPEPPPARRPALAKTAPPSAKAAVEQVEAAEADAAAPAEPSPEPEPAMADFVQQEHVSPCRPPRRTEQKAKTVVDKPEKPGGLWKVMAKLAEQETVPAAVLANNWKSDRPVIVIAAPHETLMGPGGFFMPGAHGAYSPPVPIPALSRGLPQCDLTRVAENFWGPAFALTMPMVPAQPRHWVDQQGWHWIADVSSHVAPTLEQVLTAYPMAAPWNQWPLMAPGGLSQFQSSPPMGGQMSMPQGHIAATAAGPAAGAPGMPPQAAGGMAGGPAGHSTASGAAARPESVPGPQGIGVLNPSTPRTVGPMVFPGTGSANPAQAAPGASPFPTGGTAGVVGGLFGAGQMMGWGVSPFGQTGPMAAGGPGYLWREIPPPFFNALVDLSFGIPGMRIPGSSLVPVPAPMNWPAADPARPNRRQALAAKLLESGMVAIGTLVLARPLPPVSAYAAGPETSTAIPLPPPMPALPRPRVPRKVAPPVLLPLGSRLGLPKPAEPLMATGAGIFGARGA